MKKLLLWLILLLTVLSLIGAAAEESYATGVAKVQFTMRKTPSMEGDKFGNVPMGSNIRILGAADDDEWLLVTYHGIKGYAKRSWIKTSSAIYAAPDATPTPYVSGPTPEPTPVPADWTPTPEPTATPEPVAITYTGALNVNPGIFTNDYSVGEIEFAEQANRHATTSMGLLSGVRTDGLTGEAVGVNTTGEIRYLAKIKKVNNIRTEPNNKSRMIKELKKKSYINILAYGDEWCIAQTLDGRYTGYVQTKFLTHFHSYDPFQWPVPGWNKYNATGYVIMTAEDNIADHKKTYGGCDLNIGDIICVQADSAESNMQVVVRRDFDIITPGTYEFHPFVDWRKAQAGDVIGGYTATFGQKQGNVYRYNRKVNMSRAMKLINLKVVNPGEEFSYLNTINPLTTANGYRLAGITGGVGRGIGGGVCHISSLMYEATLTLPLLITEREPHTEEGTSYIPLEFDATVGAYSDFQFINTLPYPIRIHCFFDKTGGICTMLFECMETKPESLLATWDMAASGVDATTYHR